MGNRLEEFLTSIEKYIWVKNDVRHNNEQKFCLKKNRVNKFNRAKKIIEVQEKDLHETVGGLFR